MSVYIPQYQHDIFVSYAPVDNEPFAGADRGWVTTLIHNLKIALGRKLGNSDAFSLWINDQLRGNIAATPDVIERLENSATLVLISSAAYFQSEQCQSELTFFVSLVGQSSGRVFVIEIDNVETPPELSDLRGYPFWVRDDDTSRTRPLAEIPKHEELVEYHKKLGDLAYELVNKLNILKEKTSQEPAFNSPAKRVEPRANAPVVTSHPSVDAEPATVFLAEVTADLETYRQDVKSYLNKHSVRVLPDKKYSLTTIAQNLDQDLRQCRLFVQLLSEKTGGLDLVQFQYEHAGAVGLPILQWRDPTIELKKVEDSANYELLKTSTVIATELVYFQEIVLKQLQPKAEKKPIIVTDNVWVFINASPEDKILAGKIKDILKAQGIEYSLPLEITADTQPAEMREDLEQNLLACDAVIMPYHKTPAAKVRQYLIQCRRMQPRREQPLKVVAICDEPFPNKLPIEMNLCNVRILECPTLQVDSCIHKFMIMVNDEL